MAMQLTTGNVDNKHCNDSTTTTIPSSQLSTNIFAKQPITVFDNVTKISKKKLKNCIESVKKLNKPQQQQQLQQPICESVDGNCLKIGDTLFIGGGVGFNNKLFSTKFIDYTLISNVDFTKYINLVPKEIKPLLTERWFYVLHVSHGMQLSVKRSDLINRVSGGEILAFKYTECSVEGNECAYYGFVPTIKKYSKQFTDETHKICKYAMQEMWPRKLYVYIKILTPCDCSSTDQCMKCIITSGDGETKKQTCLKRLPWDEVYLMMGDVDETCVDKLKTPRQCEVCAQCHNCSKSTNFCRIHRVCKHKRMIISLDSEFNFKNSTIKACKKYKR